MSHDAKHTANSAGRSRRQFLTSGSALGAGAAIGMASTGALSAPSAAPSEPLPDMRPNDGLTQLSERPFNAETPAHLLDERITPAHRLFVRNNGIPPAIDAIDPATWTLRIDGLVDEPLELSIADLKARFETVKLQLQLECAGNGRRYFSPGASGNQWTFGAIACPQ